MIEDWGKGCVKYSSEMCVPNGAASMIWFHTVNTTSSSFFFGEKGTGKGNEFLPVQCDREATRRLMLQSFLYSTDCSNSSCA